ncbi:MAG TPA: aminotransferase class III-fold pyridoxal phosphate-dependent enzyme, partial [Leptospiraceae bacterium]|nr:aminotransferase class III-fold pyridoxal phosphate-dependent enzyme [Leptospiraceae bacterium]
DESAVEKLFSEHGKSISCLVIEPLPANYGLLIQRKEYIEKICSIARSHGALILFDEVISGFRVGMKGMADYFDIKPDLVTYGKIIGGGFPVGAYAGKKELMDLVAPSGPVYQAGTLSGNPIGMRAGLAVLKKMKRDNLYADLTQRTKKFTDELKSILNSKGDNWDISLFTSIFWAHKKTEKPIRTIEEIPSGHKEGFAKLFHGMLKEGVYLAPSGYEVGFFSNAHTDAIITKVLEKAKKSIQALS